MPDRDQLIGLIQLGREERYLEYKGSVPWESTKTKIIKTAMAMANCRDGGTVVIGVLQKGPQWVAEGVSSDHLESYNADQIQAAINRHADPYVRTELYRLNLEGRTFLALVVQEFERVPVVCKKDGPELRQGAIYMRSHRMPESCEVRSQTEMREILDLAVDKALKEFVHRIQVAGIRIPEAYQSEAAKFDKELGDL
jgi:predicted HTH transcriptional regulator